MRTARLIGLVAALAALISPELRAEAGLTGAFILQRSLGARATAMGEAFSAVDGGIDSMGYNPAGLASVKTPTLQTTVTRGIVDDYFTYADYAQPLSFGVISAGAIYYDAGKIHLTLSNGTDTTVHAGQDFVEMIGFSTALGAGFSAGGVAKAYQLNLAQQAHTSGLATDVGILWHSPVEGLNLGASIRNLGPNIKFESEGDPLPTTYRAGAAYLLNLERFGIYSDDIPYVFTKYLFTLDYIQLYREKPGAGAGIEMDMPFGKAGHALLRAGYIYNRDIDGLTIGVGFREKHFIFDYALGVEKQISDFHRFSIGYEF